MLSTQTERRVAIITGGASGIGRAIAEQLAAKRVEVVIADRQLDLADETAAALRARGAEARAFEVDVRSFDALKRVVDETVARCGRLDYFFNNAGIGIAGTIESYTVADWDDVFDVNLRGVAYGIQAAYPSMIAQGFGHIVNTASMAGLLPSAGHASYTASKFGVVGLSKALRIEAAGHGVRVSVLCPGAVRTPILRGGKYGRLRGAGLSQEYVERYFERLRPITADAFARLALDAVARNVGVIVIPRWWNLLWYFERVAPSLSAWLAARVFNKVRRELELAARA